MEKKLKVPSWYTRMFSLEWRKAGKMLKRQIEEDEIPEKNEEMMKIQRQMCEDAFNKIDFEFMRPHLHPDGRRIYDRICNEIHGMFLETHKQIPQKRPDPFLKLYYEEFHKYNPVQQYIMQNWPMMKELSKNKYIRGFYVACAISGLCVGVHRRSRKDEDLQLT